MNLNDDFYTMKGYMLLSTGSLTSAMEDYLEMIVRIRRGGDTVRVIDLSRQLHVKASSVTKMVQQLVKAGLVTAEKYGTIEITEKGYSMGEYLLYRHDVLHRFLCLLNSSDNELEQAEKIEHYLNKQTIKNLERLNQRLWEEQNGQRGR